MNSNQDLSLQIQHLITDRTPTQTSKALPIIMGTLFINKKGYQLHKTFHLREITKTKALQTNLNKIGVSIIK
jgi:hypothetical protein